MHIDIYAIAFDINEQGKPWLPVAMQQVGIDRSHGMGKHAIADGASVHIKILTVGCMGGLGGPLQKGVNGHGPMRLTADGHGRRIDVEQASNTLDMVLRRKTEQELVVMAKLPANLRMGKGRALKGLTAVVEFRGRGFQKTPTGWNGVEKTKHLHHGALASGSW